MTDKMDRRLKHLEEVHLKQHRYVEALEGEKAPEEVIKKAKKEKLKIKDEIEKMKGEINVP
jgi:hypothetical protein